MAVFGTTFVVCVHAAPAATSRQFIQATTFCLPK
jgi:hypothetical protein